MPFISNYEDVLESLWVEKYRPKNLEDMVLLDEYNKTFNSYIEKKNIPHLMLSGSPGSGKTTLARILIENILDDKSDLLELNGSASNGVDVVRNQITDFLISQSFSESNIKIVYIDEADFLTREAQAALRNIIEKFSNTGRFIFTLNYPAKIDPAIHSRFQSFTFNSLPKEHISSFVNNILDKEEITYDDTSINKIISTYYPDVRKILNTIQSKIENGILSNELKDVDSVEKRIHSLVNELIDSLRKNDGNFIKILKSIHNDLNESDIDYIGLYRTLMEEDNIPFWGKIVIGESADSMIGCMLPHIHFMTCMNKIVKIGKEFSNIKKS